MSTSVVNIVEGWTGRLGPFTLKVDGVPLDLTGLVVALFLRGNRQTAYVDTAGNVTVDPDQTGNPGQVSYDPDAADFTAAQSPYSVRFKVTDGAGKVVFFPNGLPDQILVRTP